MEGILDEITLAKPKQRDNRTIITVIGVGGAGGNAVNYMWNMGIRNVSFIICNTDEQVLENSPIKSVIQLGDGLGAGNRPERGRQSAIESLDLIRSKLEALNTKMLFITAGMGGGTGTGASPVIAKLAHEMGILTVAIVSTPPINEGKLRYNQAMCALDELRESVDSLITISNDNIREQYKNESLTVEEAFGKANEILANAAKGISEVVTVSSSLVNVDFADVSMVMRESGRAHLSVERASGSDRAIIAAKQSLSSPLLGHRSIAGAKKILFNIFSSPEHPTRYGEAMAILDYIQQSAQVLSPEGDVVLADIIWGESRKDDLGDNLEIVLVATGFPDDRKSFTEDYNSQYGLSEPGSSFERLNIVRGSSKEQMEPNAIFAANTPLSLGESMTLPERESRYPNIAALLRVPAYIARKAPLISDMGHTTKSESPKENQQEGSLFSND